MSKIVRVPCKRCENPSGYSGATNPTTGKCYLCSGRGFHEYDEDETTIEIECTLPTEFRDAGAWRAYEFSTTGQEIIDLLENATVAEIDQDGGELSTYALKDAPNDVYRDAVAVINKRVKEREGLVA